jgi:hypothetical protein
MKYRRGYSFKLSARELLNPIDFVLKQKLPSARLCDQALGLQRGVSLRCCVQCKFFCKKSERASFCVLDANKLSAHRERETPICILSPALINA